MTWRRRLAGLRVDLTPARESRDYRLLLIAGTVFYLGHMVSYVALPFLIYRETGSNAMVGLMGVVELVPLIVFGLWGGALADHVDRRRLLVTCGIAQVVLMAALAANAFRQRPSIVVIFVIGALLISVGAVQRPSRESLLPRTVRHDQISQANALSSFGMQAGLFVGPTIAGLLIATVGIGWCFVVDFAGMLFATAMYARMRPYPHRGETTAPSVRGIAEGWTYAVRRRDLLGTYLIDIAAMLLAMPIVLFPAFATDVFERPELVGLLYSAETVGALVATSLSGWMHRVHHHGRAITIAATGYGCAIALVGLAPTIWLAMLALALAGAADNVSAVFRGTVWNQTIPERMRGRLAGIEMLSFSVGPLGGQARAGLVADAWSVRGAITSGGLACVAGVALTAAALRDFWRYDARTDPHAVAERSARAAAGESVTDS
ncbi:MAG: MFS transporter [Tetrasphaera sp.]|nr:MFS transporter [Tetrasphaera sp.]